MTSSMLEDWERWGLGKVSNQQYRMVCGSYMAVMKAASAGLGVAMGLFPISNAWVNEGLLTLPLPQRATTPYAYWVCSPKDHPHPATDAFLQFSQSLFDQIPDIR